MKTFSILVLSILSLPFTANAAQYHCQSQDSQSEGTALFSPNGDFVSGSVHFQGHDFDLTTYAEQQRNPLPGRVVVEDWDMRAEKGFEIQAVFPNGNDLIFSMHPKDFHDSPEMVSSIAYFDLGNPMTHEFVICTYQP